MDHLAILSKSGGWLDKIVSGEKPIESRWYKFKRDPWSKIKRGDVIYLKNTSEPVSAKAIVDKVLQFSHLNPPRIKELIEKYGKDIGVVNMNEFFENNKDKKYCILVFLKNAQKVEPFKINKKGFGMMSAWLCVKSIANIKL